jgi:hypothetical protein
LTDRPYGTFEIKFRQNNKEPIMKKILSLLFALALAACAPSGSDDSVSYPPPSYPSGGAADPSLPTSEPYAPNPNDALLTRGVAFINSTDLLTLESFPPQFMLNLKGNLPTPCHLLRVAVNPPDAENKVNVEVYTVYSLDQICAQVLSPFDVNISLGSFPAGAYMLWVNGSKVAEFQS